MTGTLNDHEWIDLGLSVKWATCNMGAPKPSDYGTFYMWGDPNERTEPDIECFDDHWWRILAYSVKNNNIQGSNHFDIAAACWSGNWRVPTEQEFEELIEKCTWSWSYLDGCNGFKITGPNGNSIFLPAGGKIVRESGTDKVSHWQKGHFGHYWSITLDLYDDTPISDYDEWRKEHMQAITLVFGPNYKETCRGYIDQMQSIRPVLREI